MQHEHYRVLAELDAAVVPCPASVPLQPPEEEELKSLDRSMLQNSTYTGPMSADADFRSLLLEKCRNDRQS
ncbi:unnamed protein product [Clonostachys chloroleuca]|uniref:Uncharacterized protein n=1 Tax=Clonostachys chloroleuca TaxID=1926264 RepID=A0AA35M8Y7_9HYPO|nr:unnamed protein product [Clonostachys chloroleuca]